MQAGKSSTFVRSAGNGNRDRDPPLRLRQLVCFGKKGLIRLRERLKEKDLDSSSREGGSGGTVDNSKGERREGMVKPHLDKKNSRQITPLPHTKSEWMN